MPSETRPSPYEAAMATVALAVFSMSNLDLISISKQAMLGLHNILDSKVQ